MPNFLSPLLDYRNFIPHGHCYLWQSGLVGLHVGADLLIALAYYSIPLMLIYFVRKRQDIPFHGIFLLFGAFIVACGTNHLMEIVTLWYPVYWLSGALKAATAFISVYTGLMLFPLIPQALALPSPAQLEQANAQLAQEVRDRKQAEIALQQALRRLDFHVDNSPLAVVEWNSETRVQRWSKRAEEVFGWKADEVLERHPSEWMFIPPDESDRVAEVINHMTDRTMVSSTVKNRNYTKTEDIITCEWYNSCLVDDDGNLISILSLIQDITEAEGFKSNLQESEERFRSIFEYAPIGISLFDLETQRFIKVNPKFCQLLGYSEEALKTMGLEDICHPEDHPKDLAALKQAIAQGQCNYQLEKRYLRRDQMPIWVNLNVALIHDGQGKFRYRLGMLNDISDRKEAEAIRAKWELELRTKNQALEAALQDLQTTQMQLIQSEKMSSLGQLVAGIAHEINNPVSFIHGNLTYSWSYIQDLLKCLELYQTHYPSPKPEIREQTERLDLDFLTQDLPKLVGSMHRGAERIRQIVLSLRHFSRLDEAEKKPVDIHEGLDSTLMLLQHRLVEFQGDREIHIVKDYGSLPQVDCYAGQLNQVFMNLLSNAIDAIAFSAKFTNPNSSYTPTISLRTRQGADAVIIHVIDNGDGICSKVRPNLFNPFFTTKPVGQGTGLGLAISYQIVVEHHGGSIDVRSNPGEGCEFIVTIPLSAPLSAPSRPQRSLSRPALRTAIAKNSPAH